MEQVEKVSEIKFNVGLILWCVGLPILFFTITLLSTALFSAGEMGNGLSRQVLAEFLRYYRENYVREFFIIFLNNSFIALVLVYFTPFALFLRKIWEKYRDCNSLLSIRERFLLYSFPTIFLNREAIRFALVVNDFSGQIQKGRILTFLGIIFPHGVPELLALGMAGAVGMEVTLRYIGKKDHKNPSLKVLLLLILSIGLAAFMEVRLTPGIFALLMS